MELQVYDLRCDKQQDFYTKMVTKVASSCEYVASIFEKVHDASITLHNGYIYS